MATTQKKTTGGKRTASSSGKRSGSGSSAARKSGGRGKSAPQPKPIRREVGAVVCLLLAFFAAFGYFHIQAVFIDLFCSLLKGLFGYGFWLAPPMLVVASYILAFHRGRPVRLRLWCALLTPLVMGAILHLFLFQGEFSFQWSAIGGLWEQGQAMTSGGVVSGLLSEGLAFIFSSIGAGLILILCQLLMFLGAFHLSIPEIVDAIRSRPHPEYEYVEEPEPVEKPVRRRPEPERRRAAIDIPVDDEPDEDTDYGGVKVSYFTEDEIGTKPAPKPAPKRAPEPVFDFEEELVPPEFAPVDTPPVEKKPAPKPTRAEVEAESAAVAQEIESAGDAAPEYEFRPIDLLRKGAAAAVDGRDEIALNRERLETTLHSFGVAANIVGVTRGPTVTRYDLELDAGVKLTKLTNLSSDLALSLGVMNVRIAPIPDKISTAGVEVPNKIVSIVYLRDIIDSPTFKNAQSSLSFAIGKDISGECVVGNIAKLPHMLIAGTTGSGKSVCLNSLLLSLLYKATPEQLRLIMIDPKMVELGIYNGIPHLYVPVVTDPKKAAGALQWAVVEMLKRYRLFSEAGVRDLAGYNAHQKKLGAETMPQVVIVVDELADLMFVASKDVEESICRVAQMGRAAGMHLIIATQRPSADVITGLMKANIPSRIAFAVSSAMESRIILDAAGAEKLIGMGDMLYSPLGSGKPMRVQGAYVSDEEREDVIDFIKRGSAPEYSDDILEQIEKAAEEPAEAEAPAATKQQFDELLPQAVDVIFETKQASVSMLQRRLKLGYSRAARLVDQMEQLGIVGPFEGSKPRQVLISKQQWQEMQLMNGAAPTERFQTEMEFGTDSDEDML